MQNRKIFRISLYIRYFEKIMIKINNNQKQHNFIVIINKNKYLKIILSHWKRVQMFKDLNKFYEDIIAKFLTNSCTIFCIDDYFSFSPYKI